VLLIFAHCCTWLAAKQGTHTWLMQTSMQQGTGRMTIATSAVNSIIVDLSSPSLLILLLILLMLLLLLLLLDAVIDLAQLGTVLQHKLNVSWKLMNKITPDRSRLDNSEELMPTGMRSLHHSK